MFNKRLIKVSKLHLPYMYSLLTAFNYFFFIANLEKTIVFGTYIDEIYLKSKLINLMSVKNRLSENN